MKYIITGGAGFIGSHLAETLVNQEQEVIVIDNLSTGFTSNLDAIRHKANWTFLQEDIRQVRHWGHILTAGDCILHLAGTVGVTKVFEDSSGTIDNNFNSTRILLEQALLYNCSFFLASTSEVYGDLVKPYSSETDPLIVPGTHCGRTAYILGKLMSEHYCMNYVRDHWLPVVVARFFNVTGDRQVDKHGMVVPTFINQALSERPITVYGDGSQTRSFCNVTDVVKAILLLMNSKAALGKIFNIGADQSITMKQLALYVKNKTASASPIKYVPFPQARENGRDIFFRKPSLEKIKAVTGWQPSINWTTTVDAMIQSKRSLVYQ